MSNERTTDRSIGAACLQRVKAFFIPNVFRSMGPTYRTKQSYLRYSGPRVVVAILKMVVPVYLAKEYLGFPQVWFQVYSALVIGAFTLYLYGVSQTPPSP